MKLAKLLPLALLAIFIEPLALAQTLPPRAVTITVTGPTTYEDKTPIPAGKAMTFNTYVGTCGGTKTKVGSNVGATSTAPNVTPGQCISAEAIVDGAVGAQLEVPYHGKPGAVTVIVIVEVGT